VIIKSRFNNRRNISVSSLPPRRAACVRWLDFRKSR
jgi:hypothetical protein